MDLEGEEDARVDIYSLACVLYECLTGEPPFAADTMPRLMMAHLKSPPPRPSITRPDVPTEVDEVIATGMAKNPDQRYATTIELADAAREAITAPIQRHAPGLAPHLTATETAAQKPTDPTLAATQQLPPSEPPVSSAGSPATIRRRWRRPVLIAAAVVIVLAASGVTAYLLEPNSHAPRTSATQPYTPVSESALNGLLLSADQIKTATGATVMESVGTNTTMIDSRVQLSDQKCLGLLSVAQPTVYAGTGWTAMRWEMLLESERRGSRTATQAVVLVGSATTANGFFAESKPNWLGCSNRQFTVTPAEGPQSVETVGSVSEMNNMLSATVTLSVDGMTGTFQRALSVVNNVVIDISAFGTPDAAVNIAHQIAAKVPTK